MLFEGCAMLIPLVCAVYYQEWGAASAFFFTAICCICFGMTVFKHLRYYTLKIKTREGFFVAFICWFLVCLVGTMPFALSECGYSYIDCIFESVSGWTTTGAWVINIDTMPRSLVPVSYTHLFTRPRNRASAQKPCCCNSIMRLPERPHTDICLLYTSRCV